MRPYSGRETEKYPRVQRPPADWVMELERGKIVQKEWVRRTINDGVVYRVKTMPADVRNFASQARGSDER